MRKFLLVLLLTAFASSSLVFASDWQDTLYDLEVAVNKQPAAATQAFAQTFNLITVNDDPVDYWRVLLIAQQFAIQRYDSEMLQSYVNVLQPSTKNNTATLILSILFELEYLLYNKNIPETLKKSEQLSSLLTSETNLDLLFRAYELLGRIYQADNQMEKALQHYAKALELNQTAHIELNKLRENSIKLQIARINILQFNYAQAKTFLQQIIDEAKQLNFQLLLTRATISLGYILSESDPEKAIELYQQVINLETSPVLTRMAKNNLVSVLMEIKQYANAEQVALEALSDLYKEDDVSYYLRFNLAFSRLMLGDTTQITELERVMQQVEGLGNKLIIDTGLDWLGKAYDHSQDYKKLSETLKKRLTVRERIQTEQREKLVNDLNSRFELKSREQEIENLANENALQSALFKTKKLELMVIVAITIITLLSFLITYMLYRKARVSNVKLSNLNSLLTFESEHDPLTGLLNRRALQKYLPQHSEPGSDLSSGLLLVDIDFFKQINDHLGHSIGDLVLVELAARLRSVFGKDTVICRWGGEEFLILLPAAYFAEHKVLCQKLLEHVVLKPIAVGEDAIRITLTGGYIPYPCLFFEQEQFNWEYLLQIADMALYKGKVEGRNQIDMVWGSTTLNDVQRTKLLSCLAQALDDKIVELQKIAGPILDQHDPLLSYRFQ